MGLLGELKGPAVGVVLSVVAFVAIIVVGLVDLAGTLTRPGVTLFALLGTVLPYLAGLVVVVLVALAFVAWGLYRAGTTAVEEEVWRDPRLARAAETAERYSDTAAEMDLADSVRPTERDRVDEQLEQLKADYAAGDLTEQEYERRVEEVLADSDLDMLQFDDPTVTGPPTDSEPTDGSLSRDRETETGQS